MSIPKLLEMRVEKCRTLDLKDGSYKLELKLFNIRNNRSIGADLKVEEAPNINLGEIAEVYFNTEDDPYLICVGKYTYSDKDNYDIAN